MTHAGGAEHGVQLLGLHKIAGFSGEADGSETLRTNLLSVLLLL